MMLSKIFGGKSWYKSMTGWGTLILALAWTLIPGLGELGVLDAGTVDMITGMMTKSGTLLGVLGIRKAASAPNVP